MACASGLPDVARLEELVLRRLESKDQKTFRRQQEGRSLEQTLSRLRRIAALLSGNETYDGLTAQDSVTLDGAVCQAIIRELDIKAADLTSVFKFAAWAARADYATPLEIFTTNYDLLLETAFDQLRVPYFDGFIGTLKARFYTDLVEADCG